ncbi:unnamed protein product [Bemisia tabaci]|uniref:39S ribosomal protein L12, mitochondrial n=1 Tax=Bemisia tabaci TaxID=7038 RepID=A0A9P0AET8_BEMTA|nr:unnamed protein product [Bemisia tabaci]
MNGIRRMRCLNSTLWKSFSSSSTQYSAAAAIPVPKLESDESVSPKIEKLVSEISQLNLLEVSELSGALKKRLNLPDAPMMPVGMMAQAAAPKEEEEEDAPVETKQMLFKVKLVKYDEKQKVSLIKEIKSLLEGMNLVQAKKFVESAPAVVKADLPKEDAEKLKEALQKVGAEVAIE